MRTSVARVIGSGEQVRPRLLDHDVELVAEAVARPAP